MRIRYRLVTVLASLGLLAGLSTAVPAAAGAAAHRCSISVNFTHGGTFVQAYMNQTCGDQVQAWGQSKHNGYFFGSQRTANGTYSVAYNAAGGGWLQGGIQWRTCSSCAEHRIRYF